MYACGFLPTLIFTGFDPGTVPNIDPICVLPDGIRCDISLEYGLPTNGLPLSTILPPPPAAIITPPATVDTAG